MDSDEEGTYPVTTFNIDLADGSPQRTDLTRLFNSRVPNRSNGCPPAATVYGAISTALAGSQSSVSISTAGLTREQLNQITLDLETVGRDLANAWCLTKFAATIRAEYAATNPNALPLY